MCEEDHSLKSRQSAQILVFFPPGGDWPFSLLAYSRPVSQRGMDGNGAISRAREALVDPPPLPSTAARLGTRQIFLAAPKGDHCEQAAVPQGPDAPGMDLLPQPRAGKLRVVWPPTAPGTRRCPWKSNQAGALKPGRAPFLSPGTHRL